MPISEPRACILTELDSEGRLQLVVFSRSSVLEPSRFTQQKFIRDLE